MFSCAKRIQCTQVLQAGEQLIWLLPSGNPASEYEVDPTLVQGYLALIIPMAANGRVAAAGEALDQ